jgi:hypothetical protein
MQRLGFGRIYLYDIPAALLHHSFKKKSKTYFWARILLIEFEGQFRPAQD